MTYCYHLLLYIFRGISQKVVLANIQKEKTSDLSKIANVIFLISILLHFDVTTERKLCFAKF